MTKEMEVFLMHQEIHKQREKEREFHEKRCEETEKSIAETAKNKLNISLIALDLLEELGFERKALGTIYLADVIETLYHERKVFDGENSFFDFNDKDNAHFSFSNEYYECGLKKLKRNIKEEVSKSYVSDSSLNDIIYGVTNDVINQYDRCGKQLIFTLTKQFMY